MLADICESMRAVPACSAALGLLATFNGYIHSFHSKLDSVRSSTLLSAILAIFLGMLRQLQVTATTLGLQSLPFSPVQ